MEALASVEDVKEAFGRDLTPDEAGRAQHVLDKASELFRREARQSFTEGRSIVRLKVNVGRAYLRERPAVEVYSVVDDHGRDVSFSLFKQWLTVPRLSHDFVTVDYSHGGDVPDIVRLTIADVAKQVLSVAPEAAAGVSQGSSTSGPFTVQQTYAAWAQGGSARLSPDDVAVARSFRVRVPNVWVQNAR